MEGLGNNIDEFGMAERQPADQSIELLSYVPGDGSITEAALVLGSKSIFYDNGASDLLKPFGFSAKD